MEGQQPEDSKQSTADMTAFVQNLLVQMQDRFQTMSESIVAKNEMGSRITELEESINNLKNEMEVDSSDPKPEEAKPAESS